MGDRENKKILLVDIKKYRITEKLKDACISMGFEKSNIFVTSEAEAEDFSDFFEYYYVTAGNTFEILKEIRIKKLSGLIKRSMLENNATYIGSSAGAMLARIDVRLALDFDRDTEDLDDFINTLQKFGKTSTQIVFSTPVEHRGMPVHSGFDA